MVHKHQHLHKRQDDDTSGLTTIDGVVYSVTYVTAEPTFDGVIGGFTTLDASSPSASASASKNAVTSPTTRASNSQAATAAQENGTTDATTSGAIPSRTTETSSSRASASVAAAATSSSSSSASSGSSDGGMSTGAKAGIAIGVLAGIGLIAALLLFFIGRKKKQRKQEQTRDMDEKKTFGASRNAINMKNTPPINTSGPAPRLSIRPMSRNLLGDFGFGGANRRSAGNMLNTVAESGPRGASPAAQNRARAPADNPFADPKNPFADPERSAPAMGVPPKRAAPAMAPLQPPAPQNNDRIAFTGSWPAAPAGYDATPSAPQPLAPKPKNLPIAPMSKPDDLPIMGTTPSLGSSSSGLGASAALGGAALASGAAAAVMASKKHDRADQQRPEQRHPEQHRPEQHRPEQRRPEQYPEQHRPEQHRPEPLQQSRERPTEPERLESNAPPQGPARDLASAPSPAFAGPGAPLASPNPSLASSAASQQGGNVYRVLMDFVPSMDDELDLKTGQLVRLLHEYDDGWALCIRLDRSHQGVVPRTCLAAKPSKPKPSHLGQYARNGPPNGRESPMGRPQSPGGEPRGRNSPAMGRPMSPGMKRPMSPGMNRPMSPGMGRPMSPGIGRPMSPGGRQMRPQSPGGHRGPPRGPPPPGHRPMSPAGSYNQAPRPLSPGPMRGGPPKRSQSPGPYGAGGPLPMPSAPQRRRSNSASAQGFQERRMSPPGPSKLGQGRPMSPATMGMAI